MTKQTPRSPWTPKEESLLIKHYPDLNNDMVALMVGRTEAAVAHKAGKLCLRKSEKFLNSVKSGRGLKLETSKPTLFQRIKALWSW